MHVLVVEDERRMAELLYGSLRQNGHSAVMVSNGEDGLRTAASHPFDVIVLAASLPGLDGFSVVRSLRGSGNQTPILMLSASDTADDMIAGLNLGADDYLVKPFSFDVFLARLHAVSRRGAIAQPMTVQFGDLTLIPAQREVARQGRRIVLTDTEYRLLEMLMRRPGSVVARESLIQAVWGFESEVRDNTVDAFIHLLREKLDRVSHNKLIHTVRGVGYCLQVEDT